MSRRALGLISLAALGGCAPVAQVAGRPPLGFAGPRLEPDALVSFDGARLPLTVWRAEAAEPWAVIVALHGMNDYAEAFTLAAPAWAKAGITTYAYDQRGFGRGAQRGVWGGEQLMVEDLRTACALVRAAHPRAVLAVVGESMGGAVTISAFASERPPTADRLVLIAPAVWGWSTQGLPNRIALWTLAHLAPGRELMTPDWMARRYRSTDNLEHLRRMSQDRNLIFRTRIDAMYGLVQLMQRGQDLVGQTRAPTLYLYGASDDIIPKSAAFRAAAKLKRTDRSAYYCRGFHMLTRDLQGPSVWADVVSFVRDPRAPLPSGAPPIPRLAAAAPGSHTAACRAKLASRPGASQ